MFLMRVQKKKMNKDILNNLGLNQFVKDVEKKKCPFLQNRN